MFEARSEYEAASAEWAVKRSKATEAAHDDIKGAIDRLRRLKMSDVQKRVAHQSLLKMLLTESP